MPTLIARPHPLRSDLYQVELEEGQSLSSVVPAVRGLSAQVNGNPWPQSRWDEALPAGTVHVVATPQDGELGQIVLMVAVAVASAYTGGIVGAAYGAAWGAAAAASVSVLGSLAASALIQPKSPDVSASQSGSTIRSSLTGTQNQANPYGVIPRAYGNPRWYPPLAGNPVTESAGDDQYLRMLLCLGYGPLEVDGNRVGQGHSLLSNANVGDAIRIGETNLGEYDEVDWEIGTRDQLSLYTQDIVEESPGVALDLQDRTTGDNLLSSQDDVSVVRTTAVDTTEISIDVVGSQGIYALTSTGDLSVVNIQMLVEYAPTGTENWTTQIDTTISAKTKTTLRKNWRWKVAKGQYDVRVTRVRTDGPNREAVVADLVWSALRSIQGDNPAYGNNNHVLMALRIKATDQLNGVVDQLSIRTQAVLRVWDGTSFSEQATNNPAWAYLDALTGQQVKRPITDDQINLPEILAWANFCDEAGLGYSWVHDSDETLFQRCKNIASTGQGSFSLQDGLYGIVRDNPSEPVTQMITPRNSSGMKASRQFKRLPHGIRVKYVDFSTGAAGGTDSEWIVYRDGYDANNATIFEDFETQGVTSATEADFQGKYYLRQAILRPETFTVSMDWENLAAVRGNRCSLASDVLKVGLASARVVVTNAQNRTITLDTEVEYTTERQYGLRVRKVTGEQVLLPVTATITGYVDTLTVDSVEGIGSGDLVTYGELDRETIDTKITRIENGNDFTATLTLVPAAIDIYDFANDPIYDPGITNPLDPTKFTPPVPQITAVRGDSTAASRNADGSYRTLIRVSYIFNVVVGIPSLQIEARYRETGTEEWSHAGPFPATGSLSIAEIDEHTNYEVQIRARNVARFSAWSPSAQVDVTGQSVVTPTAVDVEVGNFTVTLRPQSIYPNSQYRFYRSQAQLQPSEVEDGAVFLGIGSVFADTNLMPGTTYWYYVQGYTVYAQSAFFILSVTTKLEYSAIAPVLSGNIQATDLYPELQQYIEGLGDQWVIKVSDGTSRVAGIGLAYDEQQQVFDFGISADRFYIVDPDDPENAVIPFIFQDRTAYIESALIGSLTFSKLTDDQGTFIVENGKVKAEYIDAQNLSVDWANITNASIGTADIEDGAITSAKIGDAQIDTLKIADGAVTIATTKVDDGRVNLPSTNGDHDWQTIIEADFDPLGNDVRVTSAFLWHLDSYSQGDGFDYTRASMQLRITVNGVTAYQWDRAYNRLLDLRDENYTGQPRVSGDGHLNLPRKITGWNGVRTVSLQAATSFSIQGTTTGGGSAYIEEIYFDLQSTRR